MKPFYGMWEVFELPGLQPLSSSRSRAIEAAREMLRKRSGVIEIYDNHGLISEVIDLRHREASAVAA